MKTICRLATLIMLFAISACAAAEPAAVFPTQTDTSIPSSGTIYYIDQLGQPDFNVAALDLSSNEQTVFFDIPDNAWVYEIDAANGQLAFSYTPAPKGNNTQLFDRIGIYSLPLDGSVSEPTPLLVPAQANEFYYDPIWAPDGTALYYAHYVVQENDITNYKLTVERFDLETQQTTLIANDGFWPNISPDGTQLTYLNINFETQIRSLWVADADGQNPVELVPEETYGDLDTPIFSPDGEYIYFVVVPESDTAWFDRLTGVRSAEAHGNHNTPADWYRIPTAGGSAEQVTNSELIMIYGEFNPTNAEQFAFATVEGLYLLDQQSNTLEHRLPSQTVRNFTWSP